MKMNSKIVVVIYISYTTMEGAHTQQMNGMQCLPTKKKRRERKALDKEISDFRKYNDPNLTCPMCGSHVVKKLTVADRAVSVAAWGLASGTIGKQYECKKCGHKW